MKALLLSGAIAMLGLSFAQDPPRSEPGDQPHGRMQPMPMPGGVAMTFAWTQLGNSTYSTDLFIVKGNTLFRIDPKGEMKVTGRVALEELPPSKPPKPKDND